MSDIANKVETLMEAMPYLQKYQGKIIVIKYGGNAMINEELKDAVMHDVVLLKLLGMKPVLSHGGGPGINKMLEKLNIPVQFINGLRYTSEDIMRVELEHHDVVEHGVLELVVDHGVAAVLDDDDLALIFFKVGHGLHQGLYLLRNVAHG